MARYSNFTVRTRAFTLVEAVAVICILSILATGSLLLLTGPLRRAGRGSTMQTLISLHHWARTHSATQVAQLKINFQNNTLDVEDGTDNRSYALGEHEHLHQLVLGGAILDQGTLDISYYHEGSISFGLCIIDKDGSRKWLIVYGPTGQTEVVEHEPGLENKLAEWLAAWANAH